MEHALIAARAFDSRIISLSFKNILVFHPVHPKKDGLSHIKGGRRAKIFCVCVCVCVCVFGGLKKNDEVKGDGVKSGCRTKGLIT